MRVPKFQNKKIELTDAELVKLENLAKHFEIFIAKKDDEFVCMEIYHDGILKEKLQVPLSAYRYRLFSELCSKVIAFLKFMPSKCIKTTLFTDTSENKLPKIVALYKKSLAEPQDDSDEGDF